MRWVQLCSSLSILWHCLSLGLEWKLTFSVLWPLLTFPNLLAYWVAGTFTASSFRIWNSSTGIPSPPLPLFVMMPPKTHLISHSKMSGSRWVTTPSWLSGSWRSIFLYFFCVFLPPLLNIFCLLGGYHFCPLLSPSLHEIFPWNLWFSWRDL